MSPTTFHLPPDCRLCHGDQRCGSYCVAGCAIAITSRPTEVGLWTSTKAWTCVHGRALKQGGHRRCCRWQGTVGAGLCRGFTSEADILGYLKDHREGVLEEAKGFWARHTQDLPGWSLAGDLIELVDQVTRAVAAAAHIKAAAAKVSNLTERLQLALESGAKQVLVPSENKRDLADVPDDVLNKLQAIFYTDPTNAAIRAMGLE